MKTTQNKSDSLAQTVQKSAKAAGLARLVNAIGMALLLIGLAIVTFIIDLPWYLGTAMLVIAGGIVLVSIANFKRIAAVDMAFSYKPLDDAIQPDPDETVVEIIPAVMRCGKLRSVEVLGAGKVLTPENAMVITNKAIWVLTVPLPGVDKVVSGTDIGKWQWTYAHEDIGCMLRGLLASQPLAAVFAQTRAMRLMPIHELAMLRPVALTNTINLTDCNGRQFAYAIRVKDDYIRALKSLGYSGSAV